MKEILSAQQIEITRGRRVLFSNLNLNFLPGEITAVVGENGVGKSSLLHCLGGLHLPTKGNVFLGSSSLSSLTPKMRACLISQIGQVDQFPDDLRVEARIAQGLSARLGFDLLLNKTLMIRVEEICEELGIRHLLGRVLRNLSGGERKRVHIARALIDKEADVYILDEPDAGLDLRHRCGLEAILRRRSQLGKIVIVTLHDLALTRSLADRTIVLGNAAIAADGPSRSVLTKTFIQKQFGVGGHDLW